MNKLWKCYMAGLTAGVLALSAPAAVWGAAADTLEGSIVEDDTEEGQEADQIQEESGAVQDAGDQTQEVSGDITQDTGDQVVSGSITQDTDVEAEIVQDTEDDHVVIQSEDKPYLALGANLTEEQKKTVLAFLGVDPAKLDQYQVVTVTNEEEHQYLDEYLDSATIGTRALSSVVIVKRDKGDGLHISTKNISYCTVGMYKNALATAGLEDADIIVAGPFPISGTAALIGAMKAYADIEDETIDTESLDAAMNEIVLTGELNDSLGENEQTEEFMAYLKQKVVEGRMTDTESIRAALEDASEKFNISLDEDKKEQVIKLMQKIGGLDLDVNSLVKQAESIYDSIASELGADQEKLSGAAGFFRRILSAIVQFFRDLF